MITKKQLRFKLKNALIGGFFAIIGVFGFLSLPMINTEVAHAVPESSETTGAGVDESTNYGRNGCSDDAEELGWLVCTTTKMISKATDFLYEQIEVVLRINSELVSNDSQIHVIWERIKGLTNIVFIIFLMIVIYSQITGLGLSNYGIKKALPKLVVVAVLVNVSFLICQVAVDTSNIIGNGLREIFSSIGGGEVDFEVSWSEIYSAIAGVGSVATIAGGAYLMFNPGALYMLIAAVLAAVVSVAIGLATIASRQAVVALLVMVSPLAMVANILPNTEQWFKKWKDLFLKMLVFYPMFSMLFGASSLAGYAIMRSANDNGVMFIIGALVQAFPLFYSWSLMKMSGTFLGGINAKLHSFAAKPLAANRAWAESRRDLAKARMLERNTMPSAYLMNFMNKRKVAREEETKEIEAGLKARYLALNDARDRNADGTVSKYGQERANRQRLTNRYLRYSQSHKDDLNEGFSKEDVSRRRVIADDRMELLKSKGVYATTIKGRTYEERIKWLDDENASASDDLRTEMVRAREIEYRNTEGFFNRTKSAQYAYDDNRAEMNGDELHVKHFDETKDYEAYVLDDPENLNRYKRFKRIMGNNPDGVQAILGSAASDFNAQAQIRRSQFRLGSELTVPTQDIINHLRDLIGRPDRLRNIDAILGGLSVLNQRGDTDETGARIGELMTKEFLNDLAGEEGEKLYLGTYAQQAIANFAMFEVKDADPSTRRFGKYLNMQTAALYNRDGERKRRDVSWHEYVNSEYVEHDDDGNVARNDDGTLKIVKTRGMKELLQGTPYSGVERTAYKSQTDRIRAESRDFDTDGNIKKEGNFDKYMKNLTGVCDSTMPNVISNHLSYASGSEQVVALRQDLTGMNGKHLFNYKYFLGEEFKDASWDQKALLVETLYGNVRKFLKGQVPSQIMKTKSDMLGGYEDLFALLDEVTYIDRDTGEERVDPELLRRVSEERENEIKSKDYDHKAYLKKHKEGISKRLLGSYTDTAKEGFAKMRTRGLASEAKDKLLGYWDEYFAEYDEANAKKPRRPTARQDNNDDDDGGAIPETYDDYDEEPFTDGRHNSARLEIESIYNEFLLGEEQQNAVAYFEAIKDIIGNPTRMGGKDMTRLISQLEPIARTMSVHDFHQLVISELYR